MKNSKVIANHLHLPLQCGSDPVLKAMNRRYDLAFFTEKVRKIREARPDISLTADVIVGFPTETDEEYLKSKAYCKEITEETANKLLSVIDDTKIDRLLKLKDFVSPKSVWMIGGDGWAYDIGYNGIDHVLANKENVNILVLDTEVYSNTGGQASKSTRSGAVAKFAASGKDGSKKNLAKMALAYPHVYVGTISLGANPMQAIKVMKEAEAYNGPFIIIAYAPCIAQGIIKGMKNSITEEKEATQSGYFPIFHYNPENGEFKLDSNADFTKYEEFTLGEDRYRSLTKLNKEADKLLAKNKEDAEATFTYYQSLQNKENE
jgi:pyruvate-ferredoxin/flavodoxin oxidoreductase